MTMRRHACKIQGKTVQKSRHICANGGGRYSRPQGRRLSDVVAEAKVCDYDTAVLPQEHVLRLDVGVDNAARMCVLQRVRQLRNDHQQRAHRRPAPDSATWRPAQRHISVKSAAQSALCQWRSLSRPVLDPDTQMAPAEKGCDAKVYC